MFMYNYEGIMSVLQDDAQNFASRYNVCSNI